VRRSLIATGALTVGAMLTLSACGQQGGMELARQACVHVHLSLQDYARSDHEGASPADVALYRRQADLELRKALPLAAAANSDDGSWNSLMTTISESATVDESHLAGALRAQCNLATTNFNVNPAGPTGSP
jgi:hypothetical protein